MEAYYKISGQRLTAIANAIRSKTGDEATLTPAQMPLAIETIEAGGVVSQFGRSVIAELPEIALANCVNTLVFSLESTCVLNS